MIPLFLIKIASGLVGNRLAKPVAALAMLAAIVGVLLLTVQCIRNDAASDALDKQEARTATKALEADRKAGKAETAFSEAETAKQEQLTDDVEQARRDGRSPLDELFDGMR